MNKKNQKKNSISFKNDPFKTVKGFSALQQQVGKQLPPTAPTSRLSRTGEVDSEVDFSQAMAQLGVEVIATDNEIMPVLATDSDSEIDGQEQKKSVTHDDSDEALFLASLGQLDSVFSDNYCADDEIPSHEAEARRMKQLRQGKLKPQDTLDLHGCYREEALKKVRHFLQHRYADGCNTVLIVTGQGKRSPNGEAVLRSDVEKYLSTCASAWVAEWGRAPRQYGGEGALVIFLRQTKAAKQI